MLETGPELNPVYIMWCSWPIVTLWVADNLYLRMAMLLVRCIYLPFIKAPWYLEVGNKTHG